MRTWLVIAGMLATSGCESEPCGIAAGAECAEPEPPSCDPVTSTEDRCVASLPMTNIVGVSATKLYTIEPRACSPVDPLGSQLSAWDRVNGGLTPVLAGGERVLLAGTTLVTQGTYVTPGGPQGSKGPQIQICPDENCSTAQPVLTWNAVSMSPSLLAVHAGTIYALDTIGGDVVACPVGLCSAPSLLVAGLNANAAVADDSGLYLSAGGSIYARPQGGALVEVAPSNATLALGADWLYLWTSSGIATCPKVAAPCTPSMLVGGASISGFALDAERLYWLDQSTIYSCARTDCSAPEALYTCPTGSTFSSGDDHVYCSTSAGTLEIPKS